MVRVTECVRLCAEIAEHVTELLNKILHTFDRFLQSPIFRSETTALTVNDQRIELREKMIEILIRMNEGLIAACMSLTQYATNEEVHDAIRREVSQERIPMLKFFLQVCTERCKTVMECCTECCDSTEAMTQMMGTLVTEYGKVMDGKQRRSILAKVAYGVGCSGLVALVAIGVVTFAPVAVPAAISLGTATASTTALVAGMASGKVLQQYKKDDVQAVEEAIKDISKYKEFIETLRRITLKCKGRTLRAVRDLKSYNVVAVGSSQSPDTVPSARYEVEEVDDGRLMEFIRNKDDVSTVLKEFKRNMESLKQQTNVATTKIEEILDDL